MKLHVELDFKTPDVVDDAVNRIVAEELPTPTGPLNDEEQERLQEARDTLAEKIRAALNRFIQHGESIRIGFDVERETAYVIEPRR